MIVRARRRSTTTYREAEVLQNHFGLGRDGVRFLDDKSKIVIPAENCDIRPITKEKQPTLGRR